MSEVDLRGVAPANAPLILETTHCVKAITQGGPLGGIKLLARNGISPLTGHQSQVMYT